MASLTSWLSADVMHALGWALIHSLWQCLGLAALAAGLMAFSRRPAIRYLVAVGALALMLAVPVATFLLLSATSSRSPASALIAAMPTAAPTTVSVPPSVTVQASATAVPSIAARNGMVVALENLPQSLPQTLPRALPLPLLVGAWLCGVALFSLRFAGGFLLLEHRRRRHSSSPSPRILALCQELQHQLGLNRAIRYLECGWLQAPAVIGWLRPIVLLPLFALTGLSEEQLRAVIAHELAHIKRLDAFVNLFQILVETLLFYHPAMWWLNKRIRDERELCCDEIAVSLTGSKIEYARALTLMAEWKRAPVLAMAANRGPLSLRIFHILGRKPSGAGQRMLGLTGGVIFLSAALAAANALFGIAYPIPAAQAKQAVSAALSSGQAAMDHAVRQALQTMTKTAEPPSRDGGPETASAAQTQSVQDSPAQSLAPPSPDLSGTLPHATLATPVMVAADNARTAPANDQPAAQPAAPDVSGAPHPKTEAGIRCLLGLGVDLCEAGFASPYARQAKIDCTGRYDCFGDGEGSGGPGPLESIAYLGTNAAGDDVYAVSFQHRSDTYVLPQPGPDGKIATRCLFPSGMRGFCLGNRVAPSSAARVTSPAQARILYTRPAEGADSGAANTLRPKTEAGIRCLLGLGEDGCWRSFETPYARQDIKYCAAEAWDVRGRICPWGPLESIEYRGANATGDDVYSVKFLHEAATYILPQPGPDGRIATRCKFAGPPPVATNVVCLYGSRVVSLSAQVTSPAAQVRILYTRPAEGADAGTTPAAAPASAFQPIVVPNTPSGEGDPNAAVCRAPQRLADGQFGPQVCLHNYEWWKAAMNGKDVAPDGKTLIDRPTVTFPRGEGDRDAITCRTPQPFSSMPVNAWHYGPKICQTNHFWADLIKNHQTVDAKGGVVTRRSTWPAFMNAEPNTYQGDGYVSTHNDPAH